MQGKSLDAYKTILNQSLMGQIAGLDFLLLEAMPLEPAGKIAEKLSIPVYGIGAGRATDGQLVIMHDLIGMFFQFKPKFAKRYCEAGSMILQALTRYASEVRNLLFPDENYEYSLSDEEKNKIKDEG